MRVFARNGAADGGGMDAHFLGHFLDHHRLEVVRSMLQELLLVLDNRLADPQNRVLSLLYALHKLQSGAEALFDVVAYFPISGVAGQQPSIDGTQPKLWHVVFIHKNVPSVIHFAKVNVGFDESRLRFVVAESWTGVEAANDIHGPLDQLNGSIQSSRHFLELIPLQQFRQRALWTLLLFLRRCHGPFGHAFRDDLLSQSVLRVERSKLYEQAFPQVARAHAKWVEFLDRGYGFFNVF